MACEYCNEGKPVLLAHYAELYITSDNYLEANQYSSLDGHFLTSDSVSITHCPMCGEKLGDAMTNQPTCSCNKSRKYDELLERYAKLANTARDLYKAVAPMHEPCSDDTCCNLADNGWSCDSCLHDFRSQLKELGVEV